MDIHNFSVRVLVNSNRTKEYRHEDRTFIEAHKGSEYEIDIRNHSYGKVLAIPSVDGLCTIDGKPATDSSPGFIIQSCSSMKVKGYTHTNREVGAFKFAEKGCGYASGKGEGQNVGVIGVKFVGEKINPQFISSNWTTNISIPAQWPSTCGTSGCMMPNSITNETPIRGSVTCSNSVDFDSVALDSFELKASPDFNVETTWGSKKQQKTKEKDFERGEAVGLIEIFYSDRQSLLNAGVIVPQSDSVSFPKAFSSYATPPKGWC